MKRKYNVYTDIGDYVIWAWSAADAADIVRNLTYCRCRVEAVEVAA